MMILKVLDNLNINIQHRASKGLSKLLFPLAQITAILLLLTTVKRLWVT